MQEIIEKKLSMARTVDFNCTCGDCKPGFRDFWKFGLYSAKNEKENRSRIELGVTNDEPVYVAGMHGLRLGTKILHTDWTLAIFQINQSLFSAYYHYSVRGHCVWLPNPILGRARKIIAWSGLTWSVNFWNISQKNRKI